MHNINFKVSIFITPACECALKQRRIKNTGGMPIIVEFFSKSHAINGFLMRTAFLLLRQFRAKRRLRPTAVFQNIFALSLKSSGIIMQAL